MKIVDLRTGMKHVSIEAKIIDMNSHMMYVGDESGKTFVRYWGATDNPVKTGDYVKIQNGDVVNYSGILQMKLGRKGRVLALA